MSWPDATARGRTLGLSGAFRGLTGIGRDSPGDTPAMATTTPDFIRRFSDLMNAGHVRGELTEADWRALQVMYRRDPAYLRYLASVHGGLPR